MSDKRRLRFAIYTRKSTDEGLEQEFNSLDAQREACAAYIASQVGLGWKLVPDHYDDGGISGGTMERPALQRLLADIGGGKVDVVVVYKIDRLTRSLMDFARIVEIFDRHNASFVSVTQQFNTTTSMGRLTLNVLLSFAQFEREVTAERIRDKIAASKKKGMWMGGTVPFGYRVENRKLVIDDAAAAEVRMLFRRYLELGSVPALARELNDTGKLSLLHTDTGQGRRRRLTTVGRGRLYYMLSSPIYTGRIRHGGEIYAGEHEPIIEDGIFTAVQDKMAEQAPRERGMPVQRDIHLLNGLLFDETGDRLAPIHASKAGKRYRYYISGRLKAGRSENGDGWRIPASEIEAIVLRQLKDIFRDQAQLSAWMQEASHPARIELGLLKAKQASDDIEAAASPSPDMRTIIHMAVRHINLTANLISLTIDRRAVANWLAGAPTTTDDDGSGDLHIVELPLQIRQRGVERRLVIEGQSSSLPRRDQSLIDMVARSHAYIEALTDGQQPGRKDIAMCFGVHPEDVSRLLPLAFLSPRIVEAILTGQQPADLTARHLVRNIELPVSWAEQCEMLGI